MNVIGLRENIYIFLKLLRLLLKGTFPCFFFSSRHVASLLALFSISTEGLLSISESLLLVECTVHTFNPLCV